MFLLYSTMIDTVFVNIFRNAYSLHLPSVELKLKQFKIQINHFFFVLRNTIIFSEDLTDK